MPLTGALQADFSDFVAESQKATAALGVMEAEAKKTGSTFAKTGTVVDGFGSTAGKSGADFAKMTGGLRSIDASLNAVGLSISKPIAAIEELSVVATRGVGSLGALGAAGLALSTAMAAWEFGKWSQQYTGMADTWDRIYEAMGLNALQAETLGAKQDVLARASANAKRTITDYDEAIRINTQAVADNAAKMETARGHQVAWEREIRRHRDELPAIEAALKNHTATVAELAKQYGITERAIQYYITRKKEQTAAEDEATKKAQAAIEAQARLQAQMFGTDLVTKAKEYVTALGGIENLTKMSTAAQTALNAVLGPALETYTRMGQVAPQAMRDIYTATLPLPPIVTGLGAEWATVGTTVTVTADKIITDLQRMTDQTKAYEAETQRMADEWNKPKQKIDETTGAVEGTTAAVQALGAATSAMVQQSSAELQTLSQHYQYLANQNAGKGGGAFVTGHDYSRMYESAARETATQAGQTRQYEATVLGQGGAWGTGRGAIATTNTLNVNVNNHTADDLAGKLVTEMRRSGVRL